MQFLGCLVGDYSKSAINSSIFTGKIIGVSSHLYGFVGSNVPSFCNWAKTLGQVTEFRLEAAMTTMRRMYQRRGIAASPADEALMRWAFEATSGERPGMSDRMLPM
jgi:glucose-1-phosphate thymidylyltransferase